jgi:dTDP-glucose 4,6-dehydratase
LACGARSCAGSPRQLVGFVTDRPGHDRRYAIDASKLERELGWHAVETFETGLEKTVAWYLAHRAWWQDILARGYRADRIGVIGGQPGR